MEIFIPPEKGPRATWRCSKVPVSHNPCTSHRAPTIYSFILSWPDGVHFILTETHLWMNFWFSALWKTSALFPLPFSLAPFCLWSLFWEHQQRWELPQKDEEKNGQNLLPAIKSYSGMNFRIGILFAKNNRCPPVLLGWNFPLRDVETAAHPVLTLCRLCSYDWDLVFMINTKCLGSTGRWSIQSSFSRMKLLTFYTIWAVWDGTDEQQVKIGY